jgi:hypothetical protein
MEKKMIKKLKDLGFKKVRGTEKGFHMYELTPAKLQAFDSHFKPQAASDKPQAASNKRQTTSRKQYYIDLANKNYKV